MQLHKLLSITGGACFVLGLGGIAGAVEFGTGWATSITLLVISAVCIPLAMREDGKIRRKKIGSRCFGRRWNLIRKRNM